MEFGNEDGQMEFGNEDGQMEFGNEDGQMGFFFAAYRPIPAREPRAAKKPA